MKITEYLDNNFECHNCTGGNIRLLDLDCPYCGKTGKVYVKPSINQVFCFYCSTSYYTVNYFAAYEGITPSEMRRIFSGDENNVSTYIIDPIKPATVKTAKPYFPELVELPKIAIEYLSNRDIPESTIAHFRAKYSPSNGYYENKTVYSAGRVIFPIFDINKKLTSWQGRDITGSSINKYLFSPDFKAAQHVYNAWAMPDKPDYVIICEGVFDCLGWWKNGFKNVVATFGKKASATQLEIICRLKPKVLFMAWDYNCYGEMAEVESKISHLIKNIRIIELPKGKDSDECSKAELIRALSESRPVDWVKKISYKL